MLWQIYARYKSFSSLTPCCHARCRLEDHDDSNGADRIDNPGSGVLAQYGLQPGGCAMVIARPEPENSILEIVAAFSRKPRGMKLVVLGRYD